MDEITIKRHVDSVFKETGLISTPVQVVAMAHFYGFSVYESELDENTSGMIVVNDKPIKNFDTNRIIVVNSDHASTRKRFTIAHELGHYILKNRPQKCYAHRDSNENYSQEEKDANSFASALLMPEDDVRKYVNSYKGVAADDDIDFVLTLMVARKYDVSERAAEVRLKKLGII